MSVADEFTEPTTEQLRDLALTRFAWQADGGRATVDDYVHRVADRCERWSLKVERMIGGGSGLPLLAVRRADGEPAVLKLGWERDFAGQVDVLVAARGRGYVRVLDHDVERRALLLEPLGGSLESSDLTPVAKLDVQVDLLRQVWRVQLPDSEPVDKAAGLQQILADLGHTVPDHAATLAAADRVAGTLTARGRHPVVVHGDPHTENVLRRGTDGWAFVDPDGFGGDAAYDLGVTLRHWSRLLLDLATRQGPEAVPAQLDTWAQHLAGRTGVDARLIADWAFVERVTTALYLHRFGATDEAADLLTIADLLASTV